MAFKSAATLRGATVAAVFIVVVLVASMGKPVAAGTSCTQRRCISECPSKCQAKADSSCGGLKQGGTPQCPLNCLMACKGSCESACKIGHPSCPSGGTEACDPTCRTTCHEQCNGREQPSYRPCLTWIFQDCKDKCEAACQGGN